MTANVGFDVSGLSVRLKSRTILSNVSFHSASPCVVSLIGRNASGKTTLLKAIAGLLDCELGYRIQVSGSVLQERRDFSKQIRYLPADIQIEFPTRVSEFLELGQWNVPNPDTVLIARLSDQFEITSLLDRYWMELSSGERQRCALVRALVSSPQVLLLDESLSHLDPDIRMLVMQKLRSWCEANRSWVVWVSHDLGFVQQMSDELVFLDQGSVLAQGKADADFFQNTCFRLYPAIKNKW